MSSRVNVKTHEDIEREMAEAAKRVKVGGTYAHYKNPKNLYTVEALAIQEATDKVCVVYRAKYGRKPLFVRGLDSWLERPELEGKRVDRFRLVE